MCKNSFRKTNVRSPSNKEGTCLNVCRVSFVGCISGVWSCAQKQCMATSQSRPTWLFGGQAMFPDPWVARCWMQNSGPRPVRGSVLCGRSQSVVLRTSHSNKRGARSRVAGSRVRRRLDEGKGAGALYSGWWPCRLIATGPSPLLRSLPSRSGRARPRLGARWSCGGGR